MIKSFKASAIIAAILTATGCAPLTLYYKPGAEVSRMQTDSLLCETQALKDAPVASEIRQNPPVFFPGRQICNGTDCYTGPGYWAEGSIYTVDVNRGLRTRIEQNCMANKGYQLTQLKICTPSIEQAAQPGQTTRLPSLSENSCAIRNKDGSFQIVEPG